MTTTRINFDALLATLDAAPHADYAIDRLDLILLAADHLAELNDDAIDFLLSYDICPIHRCDLQICRDDAETECLIHQH